MGLTNEEKEQKAFIECYIENEAGESIIDYYWRDYLFLLADYPLAWECFQARGAFCMGGLTEYDQLMSRSRV